MFEIWDELPTIALLAGFAGAGVVIFLCGLRITSLADRLADRTGLGEAVVGAVFLGAATSLSGAIVSITAGLDGRPSLAFSNSIGGIAAQTAFLAVADMFYRRVNLEHAAADLGNVFQGLLLMILLALPFVALTTPEFTLLAVHPVSFVIPIVYVIGLVASRQIHNAPMWKPVETAETRTDQPEPESGDEGSASTMRLAAVFAGLMLLMGLAGYVIAKTASELTDRVGIADSLVGALGTAVVTSLPELVTTVAAVRRGALQLAVGGIIGGNTFDSLFLTAADVSYREGSLYHATGMDDYFWTVTAMLMTGVLLVGLILRQRQGPGRIGAESVVLLLLYAAAIAVQAFTGEF